MDIKRCKIFRNERIEPNKFEAKYPCRFCNRFSTQVILIPTDALWSGGKYICKTCLNELIEALDKNMVDNFQNDFEAARKDFEELKQRQIEFKKNKERFLKNKEEEISRWEKDNKTGGIDVLIGTIEQALKNLKYFYSKGEVINAITSTTMDKRYEELMKEKFESLMNEEKELAAKKKQEQMKIDFEEEFMRGVYENSKEK